MRYRRYRRPSKPQIFAMLMLASLCLLFVPAGFLGPFKHLTQLAAEPQWLARQSAQKVTDQIHDLSQPAVSRPDHQQALERNAALERENASLRQQLTDSQATINSMGRIKVSGFPENGTLIPARVMALDASTVRDSLLVGKAQMSGVKKGDWVSSRVSVDVGSQAGVRNDSPVLADLAKECLIGWVEETGPLAARVVLLTDPAANKALRVRINKAGDYTLKGAGAGLMKLVEMPRELVENRKIAPGDWVMSDPNDPKLPVTLAIGRIKEVHRLKERPVYYEATVEPACTVKSLREVFIVELSKSELQQNSTKKIP